jgi:hypothetical protein
VSASEAKMSVGSAARFPFALTDSSDVGGKSPAKVQQQPQVWEITTYI